MKKSMRLIVAAALPVVVSLFVFASCGGAPLHDSEVRFTALPLPAQEFIAAHYDLELIISIKGGFDYEVTIQDGTEIEFTRSGRLTKVDADQHPLPEGIIAILPATLLGYLADKFPNEQIKSIEVERTGYVIEMSVFDEDLLFNKDGGFVGLG